MGCRYWQLCEGTHSSARLFRFDYPSTIRGRRTKKSFRLPEADLSSIDGDIDVYLSEADILPRPRGFAWFIRRPSEGPDDETLWDVVWAVTTERLPDDGLRPSMMAGGAKETMASFFRK